MNTSRDNITSNKSTIQPDENEHQNGNVPPIVVYQVIYLSIVAVIGITANLIVLVKSVRYERSLKSTSDFAKNTTNFLVISLAIGDLGTSTFSVAIFILPSYVPDFPINDFFCKYIQPFRELFVAVSIFSVAFIALGRYLILVEKFRRRLNWFSSCVVNNVILWTISYLIFALPFSKVYEVDYVDGAPICDAKWETPMAQRVHVTFVLVVNVLLPALMVCLSYIGIICRLRRASRIVPSEEVSNKLKNSQTMTLIAQSHRIVKISLLLLVEFLVTYLPYAILFLSIEYGKLESTSVPSLELLAAIASCLLYSNAMINPLILIFSSNLYKPKFRVIENIFKQ